jgi:ribonuclease VapC
MVLDTSALVAIFLDEPERNAFLELILKSESRLLSAANALETGMVLEARRGESAGREFDLFLTRVNVQIVAVDAEQVEIARLAWRRFGKGRHKAGLNFGDCFAYALAMAQEDDLLAKGDEFASTDVPLIQTY